MLTKKQQILKRLFDVFIAFWGIIIFLLPILFLIVLATIFTKRFGLFSQERIGQYGDVFTIYKIRSISGENKEPVAWFEKKLRASKLDELPQLFNILLGDMSFVGPRPDVKGYADILSGNDRKILLVKPGITGPATLKYKSEGTILSLQSDPLMYNDTVIWPDKVRINRQYVENWSFIKDMRYLIQTIFD